MKENMIAKINSGNSIHHSLQSISGSIEGDQVDIKEVDQIRPHALNMIEDKLQLM